MKKIVSLLFFFCAVFALCSCGKAEDINVPEPSPTAPSPTASVSIIPKPIGGNETNLISIYGNLPSDSNNSTIATNENDYPEKENITLFTSEEMDLTSDEFIKHLLSFLPNDVIISTENLYDDDSPWLPDTFVITSSDLKKNSRYIRVWYDFNGEHIDAYFDYASDFTDIAENIFKAVDPDYVNSSSFKQELKIIIDNMNKKSEETNCVKLANGYFVYSYTAPYTIFGSTYSGFYEIRFISNQFYKDHYQA